MELNPAFILPQPFAWILIPTGKTVLTARQIIWNKQTRDDWTLKRIDTPYHVAAFEIAKYPTTNGQYRRFIEAGGYKQRQWWTDEGWFDKEYYGWIEPQFWQFRRWNRWYHPVVGISWYEAIAYCAWLSDVLGELISLPTEPQWLRAAQGEAYRPFAWGNEWDAKCCNHGYTSFKEPGSTSPVTQYEGLGDSPFGVVDMTGNVWEYTLTKDQSHTNEITGNQRRIAHGGSWEMFRPFGDDQWFIRTDEQMSCYSNERLNYFGFRIVKLRS